MSPAPLSIKEQMLLAKMEKRLRQTRAAIRRSDGPDVLFRNFRNRPTEDQLVAMVKASCYGVGDPLGAAGDLFGLEYILDEWNQVIRRHRQNGIWNFLDQENRPLGLHSTQSEEWGNLNFQFIVKEAFQGQIGEFDLDQFTVAEQGDFYLDREGGGLAIGIWVSPLTPLSEEPGIVFDPRWRQSKLKDQGKFFTYTVEFTTPDALMKDRRDSHGVRPHERHLATGKVVPVRPHTRHNPVRVREDVLNTSEVDFVVYRAFDVNGVVRYIGEGKEDRPGHVNSGISHNYKINEHYFKAGPMRVEIVKRHLSKAEALAVELFLIRSFPSGQLWNIKDASPGPLLGT